MRFLRSGFLIIFIISFFLLLGCSSSRLMPSVSEKSIQNNEYKELLKFYNIVEENKMTVNDVNSITGINLNNAQDVTILGPTYVRNFFMKNSSIELEDLPFEIQLCIKNNNCIGYLMVKEMSSSVGVGGFMSRWFRFKHIDLVRNSRLEILFLSNVDEGCRIVYKEILSALPEQTEIRTKKNPLGPIQNVFGDAQYKYRF